MSQPGRPLVDTIAIYRERSQLGERLEEIADRLGIGALSLRQALRRARKKGLQ